MGFGVQDGSSIISAHGPEASKQKLGKTKSALTSFQVFTLVST
jgi:hypothetical protein